MQCAPWISGDDYIQNTTITAGDSIRFWTDSQTCPQEMVVLADTTMLLDIFSNISLSRPKSN
jgi:hypothetical protein